MKSFLPTALAALFAFWCGTFFGGTGAWESLAAYSLLLALAATHREALDPFRLGIHPLGSVGRMALLLLLVGFLASWWASPVSRAGRTAVLLLPAFVLLPGILAACWKGEGARRRGLGSLSAVVTAVSVWALVERFLAGDPRAAMPLGHHNLLALWLVTLLPLATLEARNRGGLRILAAAAAVTGTAAIVASGSLAGTAALALEVALGVALLRPGTRTKRWLLGGAVFSLLAVLPVLPRLSGLLAGADASWAARRTYLAAGWEGLWERPGLGWGPGSAPWTVSEHLHPRPGINPPGELIGDLHNLPLQIFYELGIPAGLMVLGLFGYLVLRRVPEAKDPPMVAASKLGLLGFGMASLGGASLGVLALPVALAVTVAAGLAAGPRHGLGSKKEPSRKTGGLWIRSLAPAYAVGAAILLVPSQLAHHAFERASTSPDPLPQLETALRWDPHFPLYRAYFGALQGDARVARAAAENGSGVAALWLLAASLGQEEGARWAPAAAERACRLDPLSALAPYVYASALPASKEGGGAPKKAEAQQEAPIAARLEATARALLADPRLLAAPEIYRDDALRRRVLRRIHRQTGLEEGLKVGWVDLEKSLEGFLPLEGPAPPKDSLAMLRQGMDGQPSLALSVFLFRRRPWPLTLAVVGLDPRVLSKIDLPPATGLLSTDSAVFSKESCGLGETGGGLARNH